MKNIFKLSFWNIEKNSLLPKNTEIRKIRNWISKILRLRQKPICQKNFLVLKQYFSNINNFFSIVNQDFCKKQDEKIKLKSFKENALKMRSIKVVIQKRSKKILSVLKIGIFSLNFFPNNLLFSIWKKT